MDFKQIQELIKLINGSNIGEVSVEQKDFKVTIKQKEEHTTQVVAPMQQQAPAQQHYPPQQNLQQTPPPQVPEKTPDTTSNTITIKSPMIGTFYRRPAPDKPNFVEVGDVVTTGEVVCVIEAMKLFNEIESEVSGKIIKILVEDSSPVE